MANLANRSVLCSFSHGLSPEPQSADTGIKCATCTLPASALAEMGVLAKIKFLFNVNYTQPKFPRSTSALEKMAIDISLESLFANLTSSLQSASEILPDDGILPTQDGISLLEVKNELLLSYLQNLVLLLLLKLRCRAGLKAQNQDVDLQGQDDVVQKLVELRVYLEKGVRPLENRLKYNIDKIIRAADDTLKQNPQNDRKGRPRIGQADAQSDSDYSDTENAPSAPVGEDNEDDEMSFAPRKSAVVRTETAAADNGAREAATDGIYRPPKITPVTMPITESQEARRERRPGKSATLDEFIATELSSAPIAEPSIGSTIIDGGRHTKSQKERIEEAERKEYEESNYTRLAPLSKKEQSKKRAQQRSGGFGGEEWRSLGAGIDRIERLTQKKSSTMGSLQKSRKRPIGDGPRGSGLAVGDAFEKRRKVVAKYKK